MRANCGRATAATVLVVLTGSTKPEEIAAAEVAGADYILRKPLDAALLGNTEGSEALSVT